MFFHFTVYKEETESEWHIRYFSCKKLFLLYYFGKYNTIQLEKQVIHI